MELKPLNRSQLLEVTELWRSAADYAQLEDENPDALANAKDFFDTLPPGKTYADKQTLGVYKNEQLVGLVDLVNNYPLAGTSFIGLLLLIPAVRAQGLGRQVHQEIVKMAQQQNAKKLRLGVLTNNSRALKFWQSQGYKILKRTKQLGSRKNSVYLLELVLETAKN